MLYDFCENYKNYPMINQAAWNLIFRFISEMTPMMENGRYTLQEDLLYANIQRYTPKSKEFGRLEFHKRYIDIQLLLEGEEMIYCRPLNEKLIEEPYKDEKDIAFMKYDETLAVPFKLFPGNFLMIMPEEPHMPGIACEGERKPVIKVVFKIDVDFFKSGKE